MTTTRTIRIDEPTAAALERMLPELHEDALDMLADAKESLRLAETGAIDPHQPDADALKIEYTARLRAIMILADQLGIDLD